MKRGLTLIEMITTIVILAIAGGAVLPVLNSMADTYGASTRLANDVEGAVFAMERVVRTLREVPEGVQSGQVAIATVEKSSILLVDGSGFELDGSSLVMRENGQRAVLCTGVTALEFHTYASDGVTGTESAPATTAIVRVRLMVGEFDLRSTVLIRSRIGGGA